MLQLTAAHDTPRMGEITHPLELGPLMYNTPDKTASSPKFSSQAGLASIRAGLIRTVPHVPSEQPPAEDSTEDDN